MTTHEVDVLIVGAGAAGLVTALHARDRRVTLIAPDTGAPTTASDLAQGGLAAAVGPGDSPSVHLQDTLRAGRREFDLAAARFLCRSAPRAVNWLDSIGVNFARTESGWSLHTEAAHSHARVLHVGGAATGAALMAALRRAASDAPHVDFFSGAQAVELLQDDDGICGVTTLTRDGHTLAFHAREVVIATGGVGGLFARSTNPLGACGDGVAMALAAGAQCRALEFVQFHPTALDVPIDVASQPLPLLTEALRGAGAKLIDEHGHSLMDDIHPLADLAPRDVVARAVYAAQNAGRRVALDATGLDVAAEFPSVLSRCLDYGLDARRVALPVTPAAHYFMGGIAVNLDGQTSLPGLWAVGEAACTGAHGANRLASNSLLEAVVFGRRLGRMLSRTGLRAAASSRPNAAAMASPDPALLEQLRPLLWRCMGVTRSAAGIAAGLDHIAQLRSGLQPVMGLEMGLDSARLLLAQQMLLAAARRKANCGAHFRSDTSRFASVRASDCASGCTSGTRGLHARH